MVCRPRPAQGGLPMDRKMIRLRLRRHQHPRLGLAAPTAALALVAPLALVATAGQAEAATPVQPATVTINGAAQYQRIAGFGASEAFGQAETVMNEPSAVQQQVLSLLYSPTSGAGLTILRNEIRADYGVTNVFADAWSAPAFMKTNDSQINGGTLCGVPGATCASGDWRQAYANYLAQYAKDYAAAGDPLSYGGPENEANIGPGYDRLVMTPTQSANFIELLGPTLLRSGLRS